MNYTNKVRFLFSISIFFILHIHTAQSQGRMLLPMFIEQHSYSTLQKEGCALSAQEIYSPNSVSLKDAIVKVGNGCSGSFLSGNGLIITNHHCVQSFISSMSTEKENYLKQGFWSDSLTHEISIEGLTISILTDIKDISKELSKNTTDFESAKKAYIDSVQAINSYVQCNIESYYANAYHFAYTYTVYNDIRFVGFPQEDIASFGGMNDNWEWPRHSADFAFLRVYADSSGKPQKFDRHNIPYTPTAHLKIADRDIQIGDFTMVMGYPASTNNYASSEEVRLTYELLNPLQIQLRQIKLTHLQKYMQLSESAYLHKHAEYESLSNYYKKWQGEQYGITKAQVIKQRQKFETEISNWLQDDSARLAYYNFSIDSLHATYNEHFTYYFAVMAYIESFWNMDFFKMGVQFYNLLNANNTTPATTLTDIYKNYISKQNAQLTSGIVQDTWNAMLTLPNYILPNSYTHTAKNKTSYISDIVSTSILFTPTKADAFLKKISKAQRNSDYTRLRSLLLSDAGISMVINMYDNLYGNFYPQYIATLEQLQQLEKQYAACIINYSDSLIHENANRTMRLSYGHIQGYSNADGVNFLPVSTSTGIVEKWNSNKSAYIHNKILDDLFLSNGIAPYGNKTLAINFIASNHTSGGNSGSAVLNAHGEFIGINFDRNKEGTVSDFLFDDSFCRNIAVDARYILLLVSQLAPHSILYNELHNKQ